MNEVFRGKQVSNGEQVFHGKQAREVIRYVREEYGDELEFLWQDENGVWRNPQNRKWYGAMLKVKAARLGLPDSRGSARSASSAAGSVVPEDEVVEVLDLRFEKGMAREFVASRGRDSGSGDAGILLGYHMNKDNWITAVLDHGVATEEVLALIDQSYRIVAAGK